MAPLKRRLIAASVDQICLKTVCGILARHCGSRRAEAN
jgi:hypothetical protein